MNNSNLKSVQSSLNIVELDNPKYAFLKECPGYNGARGNIGKWKTGDYQSHRNDTFLGIDDPVEIVMEAIKLLSDNRMMDLDLEEAGKIGPYNRNPWSAWRQKVEKYYSKTSVTADPKQLDAAFHMVAAEIKASFGGTAAAWTINDVFEASTKGSSSGLPYATSKWATDDDILDEYLMRANVLIRGGKPTLYPYLLFHRSQPNGMAVSKDRPVWCDDKAAVLGGLTAIKPATDMMKTCEHFIGLRGPEDIPQVVSAKMNQFTHFLSGDFSGFDATCQRELVTRALGVLTELIPESAIWMDTMIDHVLNTPIWTPDGIYEGEHGLPSGSAVTSFVGCIVNRAAYLYWCSRTGKIDYEDTFALNYGDDFVIMSDGEIDVEEVERIYAELGLEANKAKQAISTEQFHFLQRRYFRDDSRGVMSIMRMLGGIIFKEFHLTKERVLINSDVPESEWDEMDTTSLVLMRLVMKMENCRYHADFEKFVLWIRENEPHKLSSKLVYPAAKCQRDIRSGRASDKGLETFHTMQVIEAAESREQSGDNSEVEITDYSRPRNKAVTGVGKSKHYPSCQLPSGNELALRQEVYYLKQKRAEEQERNRKAKAERKQAAIEKQLEAARKKAANIRAAEEARKAKIARKEANLRKQQAEQERARARRESNRMKQASSKKRTAPKVVDLTKNLAALEQRIAELQATINSKEN